MRQSAGGDDHAVWDVLDTDGRLLGQVTSPVWPSFVPPSLRNDRLAVVSEDGIPFVVIFDIVHPGGGT